MVRYYLLLLVVALHTYGLENGFGANNSLAKRVQWGSLEDQFVVANKKLRGNWKDVSSWKSRVCSSRSFWSYDLGLDTLLSDLSFNQDDNGPVQVKAHFKNVLGTARGSVQSGGTFCQEIKGTVGIGIEWGNVEGIVAFGNSGSIQDISIQITKTEIGKLDLGKYFPGWFENMMTGITNRGLTYVWRSSLGGWLNKKITHFVREKLPDEMKE